MNILNSLKYYAADSLSSFATEHELFHGNLLFDREDARVSELCREFRASPITGSDKQEVTRVQERTRISYVGSAVL